MEALTGSDRVQGRSGLTCTDRLNIAKQLNQTVDQVRRAENSGLRSKGKETVQWLEHMCWRCCAGAAGAECHNISNASRKTLT